MFTAAVVGLFIENIKSTLSSDTIALVIAISVASDLNCIVRILFH